MSTFNIKQIRANLKTLLQTVSSVQNVYDFNNPNIDGYPSVIFDVGSYEGKMLDEASNLRKLTFNIYVVVELPVDGQQAAKDLLDDVSTDIITVLEKQSNDTLSGLVDWVLPGMGGRRQTMGTTGPLMWQEIILTCNLAPSIL